MNDLMEHMQRVRYKYNNCKSLVASVCESLPVELRSQIADIWGYVIDIAEEAETIARMAGYDDKGVY